MKLLVHAKTNAKKETIKQIDETHFVVSVTAPPVKGKANAALIKLLAEYFEKPTSSFRIVSGITSREKIIEIL